MPQSIATLTEAQKRIQQAYDPSRFATAGKQVIDLLASYLASALASRNSVLNWADPKTICDQAKTMLAAHGEEQELQSENSFLLEISRLVELTVSRGQTLHDPRYIGHQVAPPLPTAGLFEAVSSVTNQGMAIYEMGPWACAAEDAMVQTLGEALGFSPGNFCGVITSGGSLANLTALLTARNVAMSNVWRQGIAASALPPVLVAHGETHYCVARAAGMLGIGTDHVVKVKTDHRCRMIPADLDVQLASLRREGRPIVAVVAAACSTRTGAFDPLTEIAAICKKHSVWLHVDAAHGGAACLSDRYKNLLAGIEQADSVVWDAHKMMHVPALCTFVFYRNPAHRFSAFEQDAPYLYDPTAPNLADYDSGLKTVECTKRAAAFGLWSAWCLHGRKLFSDIVETTFDMAKKFYEMLSDADDFTPLHEPMCNIQMFRHLPPQLRDASPERIGQFQLELRRRVIESGQYYIVPGKWDGHGALRAVVMNPLTTQTHLQGLMATLREEGKSLLSEADRVG